MGDQPSAPESRNWLQRQWDSVAGTVSGWWNGAKDTLTQTYNSTAQTVTDVQQRAADTLDDVRHPLYTALRKGLSAVFGKAALKWSVDQVMSIFGDNNKDVRAFGSGTFMAEMQKWQRQLERDPELRTPAAAPAPG
jgi:hypothetical protein